jgi:hypothetical protein
VGIRAHLTVASPFQGVDSAKKGFGRVGAPCAGDLWASFMIRRKIWLHYRAIRLTLEILATFGTAALIGYWIVQASR